MADPVVRVLLDLIAAGDALPCGGDTLQVTFDPAAEVIRMEGAGAIVRIGQSHFADLASDSGVEPTVDAVTAFVCSLYRDALPGAPGLLPI